MREVGGIFFGAAMTVLCLFWIREEARRAGRIFSPLALFLGMAIFDIYLPLLVHSVIERPYLPYWIDAGIADRGLFAAFYFSIGLTFFLAGYRLMVRPPRLGTAGKINVDENAALILFGVSAGLFGAHLASEIAPYGSFAAYRDAKLMFQWQATNDLVSNGNFIQRLISQVGALSSAILFAAIAVLFGIRKRRPIIYGVLFPLIGFGAALASFFRGTILSFVIALAAVYEFDLKAGWTKAKLAFVCLAVASFFAYGVFRLYLQSSPNISDVNIGEVAVAELSQFSYGMGLVSLTAIIDNYPATVPYLHGKTIFDMLLLPIPRTIWTSKPEWYGIDDITRGMGWPTSTQSAVTMPGELYANFGYLGVLLMFLYGVFFAWLANFGQHPRWRYAYAVLLVPVVTVTFWMAFTGLMNQLTALPLLALSVAYATNKVDGPSAPALGCARGG